MKTLTIVARDGSERDVAASDDLSAMEAGVDELLALYGGCCSCATRHAYVDEAFLDSMPPMGSCEDDLLDSSSHRTAGSRLSCQLPLASVPDGLRITIAPED